MCVCVLDQLRYNSVAANPMTSVPTYRRELQFAGGSVWVAVGRRRLVFLFIAAAVWRKRLGDTTSKKRPE